MTYYKRTFMYIHTYRYLYLYPPLYTYTCALQYVYSTLPYTSIHSYYTLQYHIPYILPCTAQVEIPNLLNAAHDSPHEKIVRALSLSIAMFIYNKEESADTLIEQLLRYACI